MILAAVILSPIAVGAIRIGQNIAQLINVILLAAENYIPRTAAKIYKAGGINKLKVYLVKSTLYLFAPALALIPLTLLYSDFIIDLVYGNEFTEFSFVLVWFAFMTTSLVLMTGLRTYLRVLEQTKPWFLGYLISSLFSLVFAYPLEITFGLNGALFGMTAAQLILILSALIYAKKLGLFNENLQA
ncbi:hypothetical protein THMIRHAT_22330 [Thiosulfativibrio zosterae]|uniref:Polysaccharide biosynthesis protein C-terminal domain-containing protein n=2 Tax=Thiosulfativibrio zosterae TaxID=2675053 RepID=A0A6F8PR32_9GAMM|nr:hypothetical protein THMIRHAT_22330 [Thiosulfativibrio zosterae]